MKKSKVVSYVIDGLLIALIALFGYVQISMLATKSGNHGVPMAFGSSFLYVSTDSMDTQGTTWKGSGIIIQKVNPGDLKASTPIKDETGKVIDYALDGDVVTFYYSPIRAPDTHRLVDINFDESTGKYSFRTMGDNPVIHARLGTETWTEDELIGKVVHQSKGLGDLLVLVSPDAAASVGKTAWLLPTAIIVPLIILAGLSIIDVFRAARAQRKEEQAQIEAAMVAAGVDLSDEEAVETFRMKEEFKMEYRAKMAEEVERAKKEAMKERRHKQKQGGNDA